MLLEKNSSFFAQNDSAISTQAHLAYGKIKQDIIHGQFAPGARLAVHELKKTYGIGSSPLRESLNRLTGDGLVIAFGQRGFRVAPINIDDLWDITEMRIFLETKALKESIKRGDDAWEAGVLSTYYQLVKVEQARKKQYKEWEERNLAFHEALVAACDSLWLLRFRRILHDQHRRYRYLCIQREPNRNITQEHTRLYKAALDRDITAATESIRDHIEHTAKLVEKTLKTKIKSRL